MTAEMDAEIPELLFTVWEHRITQHAGREGGKMEKDQSVRAADFNTLPAEFAVFWDDFRTEDKADVEINPIEIYTERIRFYSFHASTVFRFWVVSTTSAILKI